MAQAASDGRSDRQDVDSAQSPEEIRQRMEQTRFDLTRRLQSLRAQVLGTPAGSSKRGKKTMVAKKATKQSGRSPKGNSKVPAARSKPSHSRVTGKAKKRSQRATSIVKRKAKQVVAKALTGAAVGAVEGAVNAVVPSRRKGNDQ